jgi:hypothetical protein
MMVISVAGVQPFVGLNSGTASSEQDTQYSSTWLTRADGNADTHTCGLQQWFQEQALPQAFKRTLERWVDSQQQSRRLAHSLLNLASPALQLQMQACCKLPLWQHQHPLLLLHLHLHLHQQNL